MKFLNSVKSLYSAVGILCLTLILGVYLDYKNDALQRRHLDINTGLEKMVRLNDELTNMLLIAVLEKNALRAASYDTVNNDLEETIKTVADLTKSLNLLQEVSALSEVHGKLDAIEKNVISLMSADKWKEARDILFGDEYQLVKKTYDIDNESVSSAVTGQLTAADRNFDRIRKAALGMRVGALLLISFVGVMFSRRTRADMAEQIRLRGEIEASNIDLERRVNDRTEELSRYSLEQEERANLEAVFSALNARLQTVEDLQEAAKYALDAMVNFFKASRGAIFTPGETGRLHRQATYAFPADSTLPDSFGPGEGTIGKCAVKGEQMLTAPADQSFWLHFGIGSAAPAQVLTYPLKSSDTLVGVIELCLVEPMTEKQQQWLEKAAESISTALRIALEREERKSVEERIHLILESTDEGIFGMDTNGYVTFINPAACTILGDDTEYIIGKPFHAMFHHSHADGSNYPEEKCTMGRAFKGEQIRGIDTEVFWRRDGTMLPVEYSATPIYKENEVIGSVVSFRDITERKKADSLKVEKEVAEEAAAEAERARQEAENAQEELKAKILEVERFNRLALGREERIIELKRQVNTFAVQTGKEAFYKEHELAEESVQAALSALELEQSEAVSSNLADLLNLDQLQLLLTDFCKSVGIASAIIDLKGEVLAAARWQRACTDFHRVNKKTCARCIESDTDLALRLNEGKPFSVYRCKNGLTDAASPIIIDGKHMANTFVGQFFTSPPDLEFFRRQAEDCGLDVEQYLEAIKEVPVIDEDKLEPVVGFLVGIARIVASMSIERNLAMQAKVLNAKRAEELKLERAAAMSLAEDAEQSRLEIERFKNNLELLVKERTDELQGRAQELEEFNKVMIGRESRVIELKEEINALCTQLGQPPAYPPVWDEPSQVPSGKGKEEV